MVQTRFNLSKLQAQSLTKYVTMNAMDKQDLEALKKCNAPIIYY